MTRRRPEYPHTEDRVDVYCSITLTPLQSDAWKRRPFFISARIGSEEAGESTGRGGGMRRRPEALPYANSVEICPVQVMAGQGIMEPDTYKSGNGSVESAVRYLPVTGCEMSGAMGNGLWQRYGFYWWTITFGTAGACAPSWRWKKK
ncbi:protein of unknown function [Kyrpidia spormannii]|uniref:Uncharacterized protein n=1 Tax=Kyrpidia spormannii TaxID=2055160 RepID=A0ACA8ZCS0_9BACL|nr:protein of unknown function [Kyrpidia spormannii]